jgi:MFS family permease
MVDRFGYRVVMTVGLVCVTLASAALALLRIDTPIWMVLVVFFIYGLGMGSVIAPASTVMQNVLPLIRAGAGSAVQNTVRQVCGALGIAVIGTVLATQYASNLETSLAQAPTPLPQDAVDAASQSVVATVAVLDAAPGLPDSLRAQLEAGAFEAFLNASHLTSALSAVVVLIAALVVGFALPKITPPTKKAQPPQDDTDALVQDEVAEYSEQAAEEYPSGTTPRASDA